ncbi:MAG: extracellular solute-binding protein [bacterium]|nr:extracellular solute-binding protein [bacterium]
MKLSRNQLIIVSVVGVVILFFILVFLGVIPGMRPATKTKLQATLEFWGVYDQKSAYRNVIDQFQNLHSGIRINYRQFDPGTYENELINALAAGKGPDIFMIHNTWLPKHYDKISPLPQEKLNLATYTDQLFPEVVKEDFTDNKLIYAFPLSIDTITLIYNKDIFNQSGIALVPTNWTEFQNIIPAVRVLDKIGKISRAGAAIGGSDKSINRATDLLNLLMLQAGAQMVDSNFTRATFSQTTTGGSSPGLTALNFYTHFTNPINFDYAWNDTLHYSLDAFAEGSVAMIFNYAYQLSYIKTKNPFLNFAVAPAPQNDQTNPVNYANYRGYTVSNKSSNSDLAWDFILLLTTNQTNAENYLQQTNNPPALRSLIQKYINDSALGVFAKQALTAKSWPQIDSDQIETIFSDMIESVISGKQTAKSAINQAEAQITQLMQR